MNHYYKTLNQYKMNKTIILLFSAFVLLASCGEKDYLVTIHTEYGDMHAILLDETPKHKANFIKLTQEGFYDSLLFHRVMENFMIQGGDPDSKNAAPGTGLGSGGPGYQVDAEFVPAKFHKKGALAAARQPDNVNPEKKSSGSQFYIVQGTVYTEDELTTDMQKLMEMAQSVMEKDSAFYAYCVNIYQTQGPMAYQQAMLDMKDSLSMITGIAYQQDYPEDRMEAYTSIGGAHHLDDQYTVFGEVIDGLEIVDKIAAQQVDQNDRPTEDIAFTITIEEMPKSKITKEYGYEFPAGTE